MLSCTSAFLGRSTFRISQDLANADSAGGMVEIAVEILFLQEGTPVSFRFSGTLIK
jgi:hypothetical protein